MTNISPKDHRIKYVGIPAAFLDEYHCSCGWKSKGYYDGREYAIADWQVHVKEMTGIKPEWPYK